MTACAVGVVFAGDCADEGVCAERWLLCSRFVLSVRMSEIVRMSFSTDGQLEVCKLDASAQTMHLYGHRHLHG